MTDTHVGGSEGRTLAKIGEWCSGADTHVKAHTLTYLEADANKLSAAVANIAAIVPRHYASPGRIAAILRKLGKQAAAEYIETKLPASSRSRSGDIGEILASCWVDEFTSYKLGVFKLRWKDHRTMAMRGDDLLAFRLDPAVKIRFLKCEVKSRARLTTKTVEEARTALLANDGRPTPHALAFVSDRLSEIDNTDLSDLIDRYQLTKRIAIGQLSHLMFAFTGNNSSAILLNDLNGYKGKIRQRAVGLRVATHQAFISDIFHSVIANGKNP